MDNEYDIEKPQIDLKSEKPQTNLKPEKPQKPVGYVRQKWFAFGCLTAILLLFVGALIVFSSLLVLGRQKVTHVRAGSYLHLRLTGMIDEHKELDQDIFSLTRTFSAREIIDKINSAATDPYIEGIVLEPVFISSGYSTLNEIVIALKNFQSTGKPVFAYLELAANRDYYLASIADEIYLNPSVSSGIYLGGVGISSLYMRDLLDKLGVDMTVLHAGEFKGAGENFTRMDMSRQLRESLSLLVDDLYDQLLNDIAYQRNLHLDVVREIYERRNDLFINGDYALETNIVDNLSLREDMLKNLAIPENRLLRPDRYKAKPSLQQHSDKIAVVYLNGSITMPSSGFGQNYISAAKLKRIITKIERKPSIKGVVLRINSPGGSALESDKIYHQIRELNRKKPIVISMGDIAASGGYYIAAPGDFIYADPYTITGSIGVVAMIPNLYNMGEKIGLKSESISRGKFSNFLNPWERRRTADIAVLQRSINSTYEEFKERVSEGRAMDMTELERVAQGRLWSSKKAFDNGLIDGIGTLDRAIEKVADFSGIEEYSIVYMPETRTLWEFFLERRFDLNVIIDIVSSRFNGDDKLEIMQRLYRTIKNDPLQMLSPVIFVE